MTSTTRLTYELALTALDALRIRAEETGRRATRERNGLALAERREATSRADASDARLAGESGLAAQHEHRAALERGMMRRHAHEVADAKFVLNALHTSADEIARDFDDPAVRHALRSIAAHRDRARDLYENLRRSM